MIKIDFMEFQGKDGFVYYFVGQKERILQATKSGTEYQDLNRTINFSSFCVKSESEVRSMHNLPCLDSTLRELRSGTFPFIMWYPEESRNQK